MLAALSGCSAIGVLNALTPTDTYERSADIAYGTNSRMKLDVYRPTAKSRAPGSANTAAPVVVFFYGGNWDSGSKDDYRFVAEALAERGIVAVIPDYRLYPEVRYPAFVEDSAAAVAWTFREIGRYDGDASRITLVGHSAGAYNAAMVAYDPQWLAAQGADSRRLAGFAGLAGPYNFLPIVDPGVRAVFDWPATPASSQPVNHVTKGVPPTLLIVAVDDRIVDPEQNTMRLAEKLASAGAEVSVRSYAGVSHPTLIGAMAPLLRGLAPVADAVSTFAIAH